MPKDMVNAVAPKVKAIDPVQNPAEAAIERLFSGSPDALDTNAAAVSTAVVELESVLVTMAALMTETEAGRKAADGVGDDGAWWEWDDRCDAIEDAVTGLKNMIANLKG